MWFDLRGRNLNIEPNAMNTEDVNDPEVKDVQDDTQAPEANAEQAAETAVDAAPEAAEGGQEEATDWQDKYLRLYAEFDNFRKRTMRERGDLIRNASMDVL